MKEYLIISKKKWNINNFQKLPKNITFSNKIWSRWNLEYAGEYSKLLFWCGDPRTHEDALDHLNYSLNSYWGGYKIKKTDTRNKYDMLTWGMLKVGSFDVVPQPEYNTVKNYVIR